MDAGPGAQGAGRDQAARDAVHVLLTRRGGAYDVEMRDLSVA
jgi:hypothetical protein